MNTPSVLPSNSDQRTGIPCPKCAAFIELSITDLLRRAMFRCRKCGLELTLNRFQSRESLDALSQLQGALESFEAIKNRYKENPGDE
jgi:hypothetical protein